MAGVFDDVHGLATAAQLAKRLSRREITRKLRTGELVRVCHGVYALSPPDVLGRLAALDLVMGQPAVACLATAAWLHGFDTERDPRLHVFDPGVRMRPTADVMVHQRLGAPLQRVQGRLATTPGWTAVEVARALRRPRALAALDAAVRAGVPIADLAAAADEQKGRRGIVAVRNLLPHVDGRSESPMESEARLVFLDHGITPPVLQLEIRDLCGSVWRLDFAWPSAQVYAEYDSMEWHANPQAWKHDRLKVSRLGEMGWTGVPMVVDDIRRTPVELALRIDTLLRTR